MFLGVDLCSNTRMEQLIERSPDALANIFSEDEHTYCERRKQPEQHYAAIWAAKEAYLKALGLSVLGFPLSKLEVTYEPNGRPRIHVTDPDLIEATRRIVGSSEYEVKLSISHEADLSIAVVVIL